MPLGSTDERTVLVIIDQSKDWEVVILNTRSQVCYFLEGTILSVDM